MRITARKMTVIVTEHTRGDGTEANPYRTVVTYWGEDGARLAEFDSVADPAPGDRDAANAVATIRPGAKIFADPRWPATA